MKKFILHIFAEGDQEEDVSFDTEAERDAFSHGFTYGAGLYGGDGAETLTPEELKNRDK